MSRARVLGRTDARYGCQIVAKKSSSPALEIVCAERMTEVRPLARGTPEFRKTNFAHDGFEARILTGFAQRRKPKALKLGNADTVRSLAQDFNREIVVTISASELGDPEELPRWSIKMLA